MREAVKSHLVVFGRMVGVALTVSIILIFMLYFGFHSQTAREQNVREAILNANLAQGCILALPIEPDSGRDPKLVSYCFTQYGLPAPVFPEVAP